MLTLLLIVVAALAVARLTRLITEDRITLSIRRAVVNKYGEESLPAYFIHCPWCVSIYVSGVIMAPVALLAIRHFHPEQPWWVAILLALLAIPAASHIAGMLNRE